MRRLLTLAVLLAPASVLAQEKAELPRVVLLGDSIRLGYAPLVAKKLEGVAVVVHPGMENCADTPTTLKGLDRWLGDVRPAVVHFNCGLHDLKLDRKTKAYQVPREQYAA